MITGIINAHMAPRVRRIRTGTEIVSGWVGYPRFPAMIRVRIIRATPIIRPGTMPAANRPAMETSMIEPYSTMIMLGGDDGGDDG